jgi:hypothetical protein
LVALRLRGGLVEVGPVEVPVGVEDLGVRRLVAVVERELSKLGAVGEGGLAALPIALVVLQAMVEVRGPARVNLCEAGFLGNHCVVVASSFGWLIRDLDVFGMLASEAANQHADESACQEVEEGQGHRRIIPWPDPRCSTHPAELLNPTGVSLPLAA